jgi:hypothetical protein
LDYFKLDGANVSICGYGALINKAREVPKAQRPKGLDKTSNGYQLKVTDANLDAAKKFLDTVVKVAPPVKAKSTAKAKASNVTRMPNKVEKLERKVAARPRAGSREPRATFSA